MADFGRMSASVVGLVSACLAPNHFAETTPMAEWRNWAQFDIDDTPAQDF
jgi:hypothetical protein